jgi:hypothetical protein
LGEYNNKNLLRLYRSFGGGIIFGLMGELPGSRNPNLLFLNMTFHCHTMCHTFSVFKGLAVPLRSVAFSKRVLKDYATMSAQEPNPIITLFALSTIVKTSVLI